MKKTIFFIKLIHSALFLLIIICSIYLLYATVFDRITPLAWAALSVVCAELLVLITNNWECPLTGWAEQKGAASGSVADLFLPKWISDRLFRIFIVVFVLILVLLAWRIWF